ncbi:hypothetical protein BY996DRAFT_8125592 [Phakopsora pachyrhizi]|nr:hypothetical protein BY996DRAFT_8125592 [Phakopsora pachyrhizi]
MIIRPPGKIRLDAFVIQLLLAFQMISCMYENIVIQSRGAKHLEKLPNSLKDLGESSLDGSSMGAVEETSHLQVRKTVPASKAIEINKEILQLRAGYEDLINRVNENWKNNIEGSQFDIIYLQKILGMVNILTTVRSQQLTAHRILRVAQLELQHQTDLGPRTLDSETSIKVAEQALDSILRDFVSESDPWSVIPSPIFTNVLDYLLKNHLVDLRSNVMILRHPRVHELIADTIWTRYINLKEFNPLFLSLDIQNYVSSHPSMKDYNSIMKALEPKAWKAVVGIFLNKFLTAYAPHSTLRDSSKEILTNLIKSMHMEVPNINNLLDKFTGETFKSFSALEERLYPQMSFDWFFCHLTLFHILKSQVKFASGDIVQRVTQELNGFEKVFGLLISRMELTQAIAHLGFSFDLNCHCSIMYYIRWIDVYLNRVNNNERIRDFNEIKVFMQKKFNQQEILHMILTWREKMVSSAKALENVKKDYRHYMSTVSVSNGMNQEEKNNSIRLVEMGVEFEKQINLEILASNLVEFIDDWVTNLQAVRNPFSENPLH